MYLLSKKKYVLRCLKLISSIGPVPVLMLIKNILLTSVIFWISVFSIVFHETNSLDVYIINGRTSSAVFHRIH